MEEKDLNSLLKQLRAELTSVKAMDQQGRELLRDLDKEIRAFLEKSEDELDDSLLERLQDSINHFEATHPRLTTALSQLLNALNNAGI
jgi:chromosome segregation ATPase